jgi:multidrug efflux pump
VATVCGHFPLTLVSGPGALARNSIGIVLVGGMTIGTLFTLFVVPSLYVLIAKDHHGEKAVDGERETDGRSPRRKGGGRRARDGRPRVARARGIASRGASR